MLRFSEKTRYSWANRLIVLRGPVKALRQSRVFIGVPLSVDTRSLTFFTHVHPLSSPYTQ